MTGKYLTDAEGTLIVPDAATLTRLDISGRTDVRALPALPAALVVYANRCVSLTRLDLPAATTVYAAGCTALTSIDLPSAKIVDVHGCPALVGIRWLI